MNGLDTTARAAQPVGNTDHRSIFCSTESNMTATTTSSLRFLPLAKVCMAVVSVCLAGPALAQTTQALQPAQPLAASTAPAEAGSHHNVLPTAKAGGSGAKSAAQRDEDVSLPPVRPNHYPSSPLPPVPAPPVKR